MSRPGIPQLRVRTESSFNEAYGPLDRIASRLVDLGTPAAGCVDPSTWSHVRWEKAMQEAGIRPLFGTEIVAPAGEALRPVAWCLARDAAAFYRFSTAIRREGADPIEEIARERSGLFVFPGDSRDERLLDVCDFVDVRPGPPSAQASALAAAKRHRKPLIVTSDPYYPAQGDLSSYLALGRRERTAPAHILDRRELAAAIPGLSSARLTAAISHANDVAAAAADRLARAPMIHYEGDLQAMVEEGRRYRLAAGHIAEWTPEYAARLARELEAIEAKDFGSYFMVVSDLVRWAKGRMIVGPARGSSAGSLACYLLRITEVDPIAHKLLFERFIDANRHDLPDIDIDFADSHRDECFTYLAERYGPRNVARIGNISRYKARSVMAVVCKSYGVPDHERFKVLDVLIEYASGDSRFGRGLEDTLENTEAGRRFAAEYPEAAKAGDLEGHASHTSVHAAGVMVCNAPIDEFCTIGPDGVAHLDKPDAEALNLLKIDALGLRTLGIFADAGASGEELYGLPLNDPNVFQVFNDKRFVGIFQFEGAAMRSLAENLEFDRFETIDHVTALARPGPFGAGVTGRYIDRFHGREPVTFTHEALAPILGDTFGTVLYQEQVMQIVYEIGGFDWSGVAMIRKAMSGRRGVEFFSVHEPKFIEGAARHGIDAATAKAIWEEICTFGAWGMNRSHTVSYSIISYWCAWFKAYRELDYFAACLRRAKDEGQALELLREITAEGVRYVPFDLEKSDVDWTVQDGVLIGGFLNLDKIGPAKAATLIAARDAGKLTDKQLATIQAAAVKYEELYPLAARYSEMYACPEAHGCRPNSIIHTAATLPERGSVLYIGTITQRRERTEMEAVRVGKRKGRALKGPELFFDMNVVDDTGQRIIARIDRWDYPRWKGKAERLNVGDDVLIRGERVPGFPMIKVDRIRCLTRPGVFDDET